MTTQIVTWGELPPRSFRDPHDSGEAVRKAIRAVIDALDGAVNGAGEIDVHALEAAEIAWSGALDALWEGWDRMEAEGP